MTLILFLTFLFIILLTKWTRNNAVRLGNKYRRLDEEYNGLAVQNLKLQQENNALRKELEQTTALYEVTKEICKSLDENKIFELFKEQISRQVIIEDMRFIKKEADLSDCRDYVTLPLEIDKGIAGYLCAKGIKQEQAGTYHILAQQFLLGIRRAVLYQKVQDLTITDSLTAVLNRRYWQERFAQEIDRSIKFKLKFSFFMVDIDRFKEINDQYGHLVGDAVLKEVSKRLRENTRQIDLVCRYGGEEFSVVLIETDKAQALVVAERIRKLCEEKYIKVYDETIRVTVSIGISNFPEDFDTQDSLVEKADSALYKAKQDGRNKVCVYNPLPKG